MQYIFFYINFTQYFLTFILYLLFVFNINNVKFLLPGYKSLATFNAMLTIY